MKNYSIAYYFNHIMDNVRLNRYAEVYGHPNWLCYNDNNHTMTQARYLLRNDDYLKLCRMLDAEIAMMCPKEGSFIGYKKGVDIELGNRIFNSIDHVPMKSANLVVLDIPAEAKRSSGFGTECRCSKAFVKKIINVNTRKEVEISRSIYEPAFIYKAGQWVKPDYFDEDRFNDCSNGIHFFMTEQEVLAYV